MRNYKLILLIIILFGFQKITAQSEQSTLKNSQEIQKLIPITVTVGGDFIVTGSFTAFPTQRLDHLISQLFLEAKKEAVSLTNEFEYSKRILKELDKYSQRNILLKRANGTERKIDLEKFRITGDFINNPYLLNDDVIIFPAFDIDKDFIVVEGAVNKPRKFQYVEGDKLSDAILFSMGISKAYENVEKAEISRLSYNGQNEQLITVSIDSDFDLMRGDRIRIVAEETNRKDFNVTVIGEVYRPGKIFITQSSTTILEVIEKAGGLRPNAWLKKIRIMRGESTKLSFSEETPTEIELREVKRRLRWDNYLMSRLSNINLEDTLYFNLENELKFFNTVGNLDYTELDDSTSEVSKFIIKDGDLLIIPEFENVVHVFGQVPNTGKYDFVKGRSYEYYVEKAGGFGEFAEEDEVVLIKSNSKNWLPFEDNENLQIEPGDFIWVPKEPQRTLAYYLEQAGSVASILGPIATIVVIIVTNSGK